MANATFGTTQTAYVIPYTTIAANPIHYVAATDEDTIVVTFVVGSSGGRSCVEGFHGMCLYREIAKIGPAGMGPPVQVGIPGTLRSTWTLSPLSDGLVVTGKDWWYATLDDREGVAATTFVKSDGSRATWAKPTAAPGAADASNLTNSNSWQTVVIPGEKPRVLEITYHAEDTMVREVDWSGAARVWRLPAVSAERAVRLVAQPLPDGRIALLSNHDGLSLYLLADEGHADVIPLRNVRIQQFDAAIDGAGRIAIVAVRNAIVTARNDTGTIEAAIIDPAHPDHAEWSSLRHDVRVRGLGAVRVVTTANGFAAAWINELDGGRIEATDIDPRGHGGPVVEVGRVSSRRDPFLGLEAKHEALLFWWDDGEHLFQRRLPGSLRAYAVLDYLGQSVCGTSEAHPEESRRQP